MSPFQLLAGSFVIGVLLGASACPPVALAAGLALTGCVLSVAFARRRCHRALLPLLAVSAAATGAASYVSDVTPSRWDVSHLPAGAETALLGQLCRDIRPGERRATTVLRVRAARLGGETIPLTGHVVVRAFNPPPLAAGRDAVAVGRLRRLGRASDAGAFDASLYYARRYGAHCALADAAVIPVESLWDWSIADARWAAAERVRALTPAPEGSVRTEVMLSMVFGAGAVSLPEETLEAFRRAGSVHVLVVSGTQVAIVAGLGIWLARRRRASPWGEAATVAVFVGAYALLIPMEGTVQRTLSLLLFVVIGRLHHRAADLRSGIVAGVFCILAAHPGALWDLSLQLSVTAVLGAALGHEALGPRGGASPLSKPLRWTRDRLWMIAAMSLGASLATTPIVAGAFGMVSFAGPLANLVAVPLAGVLTLLMFISTPLGFALPPVARALNLVSGWIAELIARTSVAVGEQPWAAYQGERWPDWLVALSYAMLIGIAWWGVRWRKGLERRRSLTRAGRLASPAAKRARASSAGPCRRSRR